ncbi:MAG: hypothetical protein ACXWAT_09625 [Methylobacter sp.]
MTIEKVCCRDCLGFIPDQIGSGSGIGECKAYKHYVDKGESKERLRLLLIELGNDPGYPIFWGGTLRDRSCKKFKPVLNPIPA